ncbi:hypothetical protein HDU97_002132 [Phlyctochytrium planicorne]|nr:hypothetical protein HDU97_002132 [Phlyctochytrium planicorne]
METERHACGTIAPRTSSTTPNVPSFDKKKSNEREMATIADCVELRAALPSAAIPADCCTFSGVGCENGRIVELRLVGSGYSGSFPMVPKLTALRVFVIQSTLISGDIPDFVWDLVNLKDLSLVGSRLTGGIPEKIGNLRNLERLQVFENKLRGPAPESIGTLTKLDIFQLRDNFFEGPIPASYGNLVNARLIGLGNCRFTGTIPESFSKLQTIQILDVSGNMLTGTVPDNLLKLPTLTKLAVSSNRLYGDFTEKFKLLQNPTLEFYMQQNYFIGKVPEIVNVKTFGFDNNCYQTVLGSHGGASALQRSSADCDTFYKSLQTDPTLPISTPTSPSFPPNTTSSLVVITIPNPTNPSGPAITVTETLAATATALSSIDSFNPTIGETPRSSSPPPNIFSTIIVNGTPQVIPVADKSQPSTESSSPNVAVIAAVVVAVVLLAVAAVFGFVYIRRKRSRKSAQESTFQSETLGRGSREGCNQLHHSQTYTAYTPAAATSSKTETPTHTVAELKAFTGSDLWRFKEASQPGNNIVHPKFVEAGLLQQNELSVEPSSSTSLSSSVPVTPVNLVNEITKQPVPSPVTLVNELVKQPSLVAPPRLSSTPQSKSSLNAEPSSPSAAYPEVSKYAYTPTSESAPPMPNQHISMSDASTWTPSQVAEWLESADVSPRLAAILKEHGVTGYQLLLMSEGKLLDMGIEIQLSRRIVMEAVETLRAGNARETGHRNISAPLPPQYA